MTPKSRLHRYDNGLEQTGWASGVANIYRLPREREHRGPPTTLSLLTMIEREKFMMKAVEIEMGADTAYARERCLAVYRRLSERVRDAERNGVMVTE